MRTADFDYHLPHELIAQTPAEPRDHSRLMVLHRIDGAIENRRFHELGRYLRPGDLLVLNDSRVIPARLTGRRRSGGMVEILLLRRSEPGVWEALVKPSRRVKAGETVNLIDKRRPDRAPASVEVLGPDEEGLRIVRLDSEAVLEELGEVPLPPYVHGYQGDPERYQTVYSREKGSVAAPTAGLHFTPELLAQIRQQGIETAFVTLHVGLDSFRPLSEEDPHLHRIHREYGELSEETAARINAARARGGRAVCAGTTTARLLEQAAAWNEDGDSAVKPFRGWATLFILPGHRFRLVDSLITNFHLPRSTLLMLVSAFAGKGLIDTAYEEAIREGYRFYSFGDAMLIL
ncbi:MAG: tRNA preQ1(34) S-adenosylmethionine ribosyltransferase-isomerase QueA [Chloroflexi bacterium]|nr:tRNA preQ1(34) S-adenosylmethionine ribosyltransferase-isomerase QueA [Chloroflexota bacterium]